MNWRKRQPKFERVERIEQGERGKPGDPGPAGPAGKTTVVHDEARERKRDRRALYRAAQLIAVPVAIVLLAALAALGVLLKHEINTRVKEREQTTFAICEESRKNRDGIRKAISSSADPLELKPGDYGYSYAQEHPEEARNQSRKLKAGEPGALRFFPPIVCIPPGGKIRESNQQEGQP